MSSPRDLLPAALLAPRAGRLAISARDRAQLVAAARLLAGGRVLLGGTCLVAPDAAGRLLYGRRLTVDGASGWRLLGIRDVALAVGVLTAREPRDAAVWVAAGAVSDVVDAVVLARDPGVRPRLRPVVGLGAAAGGVVGLLLAHRLRRQG